GGSPFTHALVSGLRGAADADADAKVTVSELYAFLYARTLAATLGAAGPQHASARTDLSGAGEWVLSVLSTARVRRGAPSLGACYVLDDTEAKVIAELSGPDDRALSLAPAHYRVRCVDGGKVRAAAFELKADGEARLDALEYQRAEATVALARGPAQRSHQLALLGGAGLERDALSAAAAFRYAFSTSDVVLEARAGATSARAGFLGAGIGSGLPWWPEGPTRLELGLQLLAVRGFADRSTSLFAGQYTQLEFRFAPWALLLRLDIGSRF